MKSTFSKIMKMSAICAVASSIYLSPTAASASEAVSTDKLSVKSNQIQTIDYKAGDKFEDLQFLKKAIGDKRIVMLGESSHGAAEFNKAKVRIAQFLNKEMGFNVIAFESGLADASGTYANISKLTAEETLRKSIYPVWHTKELVPLYEDIKKQSSTKQPFILTGFDMQPSKEFSRFMRTWFEPIDKKFAEEAHKLENKLIEVYYNIDWGKANWDKDYAYLLNGYTQIQNFMTKNEAALQAAFPGNTTIMPIMNRVIEDRLYLIKNVLQYQVAVNNMTPENFVISTDLRENVGYLRDEMMANTLTWLIDNVYKDQKVIVWGHNYHIRKNNSVMETPIQLHPYVGGSVANMTELMPSRLKEQMYVTGLFMYQGSTAGNDGKPMPVNTTHNPNSLEVIMKTTGTPYSFVDLTSTDNQDWKNSARTGLYWGMFEEPFVPTEQYDGILFIDKVMPAQYLSSK